MAKKTKQIIEEQANTEAMESFIKRFARHFQKQLVGLLAGVVRRRHIPDLILNTGKECYTDHSKIVLGLDQPDCENESELFGFVGYVLEHETGHILYTTQKPWMYGINTGIKHVVAHIEKLYGYKPSNAVGEANLRMVLARMSKDGHPVPTYEQIAQFVHYVCNATEDGRIERQLSAIHRIFARLVRLFRGKMWLRIKCEAPEGTVITPMERFSLYMNSILSLATCHVYLQDFWKHYAGTPEAAMVDKLRIHVTKAVYSRKCKQCMNECIAMVDLIAPTFMEAFLSDPGMQFESFLQQLLEEIMNAHGEEGFSERKEAGEQDANGNGKTPFGVSVLGSPEVDEEGNITGNVNENEAGDAADAEAAAMNASQGQPGMEGNKKREGDNKGSHQAGTIGGASFDADALKKEMEEAASKVAADFSVSEGNIRSSEGSVLRQNVSDTSSNATAVAKKKDINFVEVQRAYTVDIPLPFIIEEQAKTLRNKVQKIFKPKNTGVYKNRTQGRVSVDRLFTLAINEGDCFEIRKKPDKFSGCCYILQDNSGSMGSGRNSKRMFASEASARIEYAFKDFMPLKIVAFDEGGKVVHEVIKNWNDNFAESCSYNFFHKGRSGCSNADYFDITIATEELMARPERERILIVVSDGLPCGAAGLNGTPEEAVKQAVDYARSRGIKVVGVYISDVIRDADRKAYESMYGSSCVFTDTDHIADELARVMTTWAHV